MPIKPGKAKVIPIGEMLTLIEEKKLVLPQFQRPLKWNWEKKKDFLHSISRGLPTGMYLVWSKTPNEGDYREITGFPFLDDKKKKEAMRKKIDHQLLDGQQRLTFLASLVHLSPEEDDSLRYVNCETKKITTGPKKVRGQYQISFSQSKNECEYKPKKGVFSIQQLMETEIDGLEEFQNEFGRDRAEPIQILYEGLTRTKVPVQSLANWSGRGRALSAFDKVNTAGTRLSAENMAEAKLVSNFPMLYPKIKKQIDDLSSDLYPNRKWNVVFTRSMLIKSLLEELYRSCNPKTASERGLDVFNATYRTDYDYSKNQKKAGKKNPLQPTRINTAWNEVAKSMEYIKQILEDFNLTDPKRIVPSYVIVAATYLRAHHSDVSEVEGIPNDTRKKLVAWMIRTQLWRPHTGGSTWKKLDADCNAARNGDWEGMYKVAKSVRKSPSLEITERDIGLPLLSGVEPPKDGQFVLELIRQVALHEGASDLLSNSKIHSKSRYSLDHIFPESLVNPESETVTHPSEFWDHPLNIMFLLGTRTNASLSNELPEDYIPQFVKEGKEDCFEKQCVPIPPRDAKVEDNFLKLENYHNFLEERGSLLVEAANNYLKTLE